MQENCSISRLVSQRNDRLRGGGATSAANLTLIPSKNSCQGPSIAHVLRPAKLIRVPGLALISAMEFGHII